MSSVRLRTSYFVTFASVIILFYSNKLTFLGLKQLELGSLLADLKFLLKLTHKIFRFLHCSMHCTLLKTLIRRGHTNKLSISRCKNLLLKRISLITSHLSGMLCLKIAFMLKTEVALNVKFCQ